LPWSSQIAVVYRTPLPRETGPVHVGGRGPEAGRTALRHVHRGPHARSSCRRWLRLQRSPRAPHHLPLVLLNSHQILVQNLGIALEQFEVRVLTKLDAVAAAIGRANGALFVGDGPTLNSARAEIAAMVARLRLPAMYGLREFADAGGLMSYGYNLPDAYRQSARLAVRILNGDRPGDLPFELPARYELIINLKAAKAIGLTIPDSFVLLADEVIE
jgi:putative tryptophan/tyrosine transport system substrate-binding protein